MFTSSSPSLVICLRELIAWWMPFLNRSGISTRSTECDESSSLVNRKIRYNSASRNFSSLSPNLDSFPVDLFVFSENAGEEVSRRSRIVLLLDQQEAVEQAWRSYLRMSLRKNIDCQWNCSSFLFLVCRWSLNSIQAWLAFVTHISST